MSPSQAAVIVTGMRNGARTMARLTMVTALTAGAVLGGSSGAHADPPPGWGPGEYGNEYDFGNIQWTHHGWYAGVRGNTHTGYVNVEEDDDGLTVVLDDWTCPSGVTPPGPYEAHTPSRCTWRSGTYVNDIDWWDVSSFDQARDKLLVRGVFTDSWADDDPDTVTLDLVLKASDVPEVAIDESGPVLDYSEFFNDVRAIGTVDGRKVAPSARRTQTAGSIGFYLNGWERTP